MGNAATIHQVSHHSALAYSKLEPLDFITLRSQIGYQAPKWNCQLLTIVHSAFILARIALLRGR